MYEWLERVAMLDELIELKQAESDKLWGIATRTTANMDGMPHGCGVSDPVGNAVAKLVDLARETDALIDMCVNHRTAVISALEKLPEKQYIVLYWHYVHRMTLEQIAEKLGKSRMTISRWKNAGIENLQNVTICS